MTLYDELMYCVEQDSPATIKTLIRNLCDLIEERYEMKHKCEICKNNPLNGAVLGLCLPCECRDHWESI